MNFLRFKTWQKIYLLIFALVFLCTLFLLVPFMQNIVLNFGELLVHRPLTRDVWIGRFKNLGTILLLVLLFTVIIGFIYYLLKCQRQKIFKNTITGIAALYFSLMIMGFLTMFFVYAIPTGRIKKHVAESVPYFRLSSVFNAYQNLMGKGSLLDDFTDAQMLLEAAHESDKNPIISAMLNEYPLVSDKNPYQSLVSIYGDGNKEYNIVSYARFWHGYNILLKPLLLFTTYNGIRMLLMFTHIMLMVILILLLAKKNRKSFIIPVVGTWLFFNPVALCLCMTFNADFLLTLLQLLAITYFDEKYSSSKQLWIYHFFVAGVLVAFFDYLIAPLMTFGIPFIFLLAMNSKTFRENFILLVKCGIAWSAGYLLMWGGKWIGGSLISGTNILTEAKGAIIYRTSTSIPWKEHITYFDVLGKNLGEGPSLFMLIISIGIFFVGFCKGKRPCKAGFILLLAGLMPFAWYFIAKNHSYIHYWMTYRIVGITVFSFLVFVSTMSLEGKKHTINDLFLLLIKHKLKLFVVVGVLIILIIGIYYKSFSAALKIKGDVMANGKLLYSSENVQVYLQENLLCYITSNKNDNTKMYFLHFYTDDKNFSNEYGFVNNDFSFLTKKVPLPFWDKQKMAIVKLPGNFIVTAIGTGQYEGGTRFWELKVPIDDK